MNTQPTPHLLDRIRRSLDRDRDLPAAHKAMKALRFGAAAATGPLYLLACDRVGPGARTRGRPVITNGGRIEIGARANLASIFAPVHLTTAPGARIHIGDDATINFGCALVAAADISIGDRVSLGPYVTISDTDGDPAPKPIRVGDDVWLAARVQVKPGAVIGDGSVITAGSEVIGEIPPGAVAGGRPARVLRRKDGGDLPPSAEPTPITAPSPQLAGIRGLLVSDFSIQELAQHLRAPDPLGPPVDAVTAPFGQVVQTLLGVSGDEADFAVVWTRPESIPHFADRLAGLEVSLDDILADVDAFAARVQAAAAKIKHLFVPTWVLPPFERGLGMIDLKSGGLAHAVARMNIRLADALEKTPNVFVLDASRWIAGGGRAPVSEKLWLLGKVAFSADVFAAAAHDIRAALRGLRGAAKKLIVLDLDDTLWGHIVGDVGWENIQLGGHDPAGESFVEFQRHLKALSRRGVLLAVVSKNEESVALEAIARHPAMVLKADDLAGYKINWRDKAANIAELTTELNLGLQSVVFIDDNPVERARVRETLPEVFVPEWPEDKLLYVEALLGLRCFDTPVISREDLERTKAYAAERGRESLKQQVGSLDEWLRSLGTRVTLAPLDAASLARTTQLLNKTNQMNLSTRRLGEAELDAWAREPGHEVWTITVSDRFGNAGLTGILGLVLDGKTLRIIDYILSCRVMGRRVEETMLAVAVARAQALGAEVVEAKYLPTPKNKPCLGLLRRSGLAEDEATSVFSWKSSDPFPIPASITTDGLEVHHA